MLKIAFIYPAYENLGIEYLSAMLKKNGFETRLFLDPILFAESGFIKIGALADFFSFQEKILKEIINYKPDLICFSVITDNSKWACTWATKIKEQLSVPIVFGGIHPTSVPDRVISQSFIDYICLGEGDNALVDLASAIKNRTSPDRIKNIWLKKDGKVIKNPIRPLIANLDSLPFPDKDLFYRSQPIFNDVYLISTSRGCPFACAYCCNNVFGRLYGKKYHAVRRRSIDNIILELMTVGQRYCLKFINFTDEVFNHDRDWLFEFLKIYKEKIRLPFSCYLFPDFSDISVFQKLKEAGCLKVQIGVQTINEMRRRYILDRPSSFDKISLCIDEAKKAGLFIVTDTILGFPGETESELYDTAMFYHQHTPDDCEIFWLRYYPRTKITQWAIENKFIDDNKREAIENGEEQTGLFRFQGSSLEKLRLRQFSVFLKIIPLIPKSVRFLILKNRYYRFFLPISLIFLIILFKIIKKPKYDFYMIRTLKRYLYYSFAKIKLA